MKKVNPILSYLLLLAVTLTAVYFIYFYNKVAADVDTSFNQFKVIEK